MSASVEPEGLKVTGENEHDRCRNRHILLL